MPKTLKERRDHAVELVLCSQEEGRRLHSFLTILRDGFGYSEKGDFARKYGLSRFMVVRDIWALLASLLDEDSMWNTQKKPIKSVPEYTKLGAQKPRIIAYIQECIFHAGRRSGLDISPW